MSILVLQILYDCGISSRLLHTMLNLFSRLPLASSTALPSPLGASPRAFTALHFSQRYPIHTNTCPKSKDRVRALREQTVYRMAGAGKHNEHVYMCGYGATGALGMLMRNRLTGHLNTPQVMHRPQRLLLPGHRVLDVACGYGFSLFACKPINSRMRRWLCDTAFSLAFEFSFSM